MEPNAKGSVGRGGKRDKPDTEVSEISGILGFRKTGKRGIIMKILILTGRFGMGHVSAANAIAEQAAAGKGNSVEIVDLAAYTLPRASRWIYGAFELLARHGKSLYNFIYRQAGKRDENEWTTFTALCMKKLTAFMESRDPDVVVSTLPLSSLLVSNYKERREKQTGRKSELKLITCITDISSHSEWIQPHTDLYLVGGKLVKRRLMEKGVEPQKILVTGIPVGQAFLEPAEAGEENKASQIGETDRNEAARHETDRYETDSGKATEGSSRPRRLLIMGGGLGLLPKSADFYTALNAMENVQVTVITGHNKKLYHAIAGRYANIEAVGYTRQVAQYMKQADVVLTKPGGITMFEVIFSGKPALFFAPSLQQEVNNMEFALHYRMGRVLPKEKGQWAEQIARVMQDPQAIADMARGARRLRGRYRRDGLRLVFEGLAAENQNRAGAVCCGER